MRRLFTISLLFLPSILSPSFAGEDPTEAALIVKLTACENKTLLSFLASQGLMGTAHQWTNTEIKKTTDFQRAFNDYLDSFSNYVVYAASLYGIYEESKELVKNVRNLNKEFAKKPTNALAVALSVNKNRYYRNLIYGGMGIVSDIKTGFFENKKKSTEWEKIKVLSVIRPKLKTFNRDLRNLIIVMKYTTMENIWSELTEEAYHIDPAAKKKIINRARASWMSTAKHVR